MIAALLCFLVGMALGLLPAYCLWRHDRRKEERIRDPGCLWTEEPGVPHSVRPRP